MHLAEHDGGRKVGNRRKRPGTGIRKLRVWPHGRKRREIVSKDISLSSPQLMSTETGKLHLGVASSRSYPLQNGAEDEAKPGDQEDCRGLEKSGWEGSSGSEEAARVQGGKGGR